jgi:Domain of unknown function (DUF4926)
MDLPLYEDAILLVDLPDDGLRAGDIGTVVERHDVAGLEAGYSVEFFDLVGNTVAVATVPASALRRPVPGDRLVVRTPEPPNRKRRAEQMRGMLSLLCSVRRFLKPLRASLVEMGGFEPPSRKLNRRHTTGLSRCLSSPAATQRARQPLGKPANLFPRPAGGHRRSTRLVDTWPLAIE